MVIAITDEAKKVLEDWSKGEGKDISAVRVVMAGYG